MSIAALTETWGTRTLDTLPPAAPYTLVPSALLLHRRPLPEPLHRLPAPPPLLGVPLVAFPRPVVSTLSLPSTLGIRLFFLHLPTAELPQPCLGSSLRVRIPPVSLLLHVPLTRTAELKETHLAPLANTFSRSSSTSTIVGDQPTPKASSSAASATTFADSKDNGIGILVLLPPLTSC